MRMLVVEEHLLLFHRLSCQTCKTNLAVQLVLNDEAF
jgi:hypothetical protein